MFRHKVNNKNGGGSKYVCVVYSIRVKLNRKDKKAIRFYVEA